MKNDKPVYNLLDTNSRMTDSNAERNWMLPKAWNEAKNGNFYW